MTLRLISGINWFVFCQDFVADDVLFSKPDWPLFEFFLNRKLMKG